MRQGRSIATGLAALAVLAVAPAAAWAAPSPLVDTDFSGGDPGASTWVVEPGSLRLKPAVSANFDGSVLPAGWPETKWNDPPVDPPSGSATVANGAVTVDGARVNTDTIPAGPGGVLEFRATFSNVGSQHVGFGIDFNQGPWAIFSTRAGNEGLWARTRTDGSATSVDTQIAVPGFDPLQSHVYRIEWTGSDVKYYVDGTLVPTLAAVITGDMRPVISDYSAAAGAVTVDWIARSPNPTSGSFESRLLEADDARAVWGSLTSIGGSGVSFETRSGNSPGSMTAYQPVGAGGAIQSPPGRYIQYKATLTGTADTTPSLDSVSIDYTIDSTAPGTTIGSADVSGTTARLTFSSPDADVDRFECSLDGGAFATCTSPKVFAGLPAGTHTLSVRAIDRAGNVGPAASRTVTIAAPPGGGTPPPGGGTTVDTKAPVIVLGSRNLRASRSGKVKLRLTCPDDETSCKITVRLKAGRKTYALNSDTLSGGETGKLKLRLSSKARRKLEARGRLSLKAVITARDAKGNRKKSKYSVTVRRR